MILSKIEFDILSYVESTSVVTIDDVFNNVADFSQDEILTCINSLQENSLIQNFSVTQSGLDALEPYRVKSALFFAAGFGSRMLPITAEMPKPMISVNGTRIIETLIDAVVDVGISDITVVRGYLANKFDALLEKYPFIKFIENPEYDSANNILSAYIARDKLQNTYTFESDIYLFNQSLITKYQYQSNYLAIKVDETEDWCFDVNDRKKIVKIKKGGKDCYQMVGIGYVSQNDGIRLKDDIKYVFDKNPESHSRFWDDVALDYYNDKYDFTVRKCDFSDVAELDTYEDLKKYDKSYK